MSQGSDPHPTTGSPDPIRPDAPADRSGTRVVALINQKGGVGKTTTAVNVAAALQRTGRSVLLMDLDPQAHLSLHAGLDPERIDRTLYDLLTDDQTVAAEAVYRLTNGLGLMPAETSLAGVESELAEATQQGLAQTILRDRCRDLAGQFDFVLIDCPPSLGVLTVNALAMADEVVVPMQAHFLALQGLGKLFETVAMIRAGLNPTLKVAGVVLCMHDRQTLLAGEVRADLDAFLGQARGTDVPWADAVVFEPAVRRNVKLAEAPSFGQSIFDYDAASNGATDYEALAASIAAWRPGGEPIAGGGETAAATEHAPTGLDPVTDPAADSRTDPDHEALASTSVADDASPDRPG
jgi:chromosome partitioning protein